LLPAIKECKTKFFVGKILAAPIYVYIHLYYWRMIFKVFKLEKLFFAKASIKLKIFYKVGEAAEQCAHHLKRSLS